MTVIVIGVTSCGDISQSGSEFKNDNPPTSNDQLTRIGNPGTGMPDLPKAVEDYLTTYPVWMASFLKEDRNHEDLLIYKFDTDTRKVLIEGLSDETQTLNFDILKDGSVIAEGDSEFKLSGFYKPDEKIYKLDLCLVNKTGITVSNGFATTTKNLDEDFENRVAMCSKSATKCFDAGADLIGNARYYVATFIQTTAPDSYECGLTVSDTCAVEGKTLTEAVCKEDSLLGYVMRNVECDCHNGKCIDQISDKPMKITETDDGNFCHQFPEFCQVINNPTAITGPGQPFVDLPPLNQINTQGTMQNILENGTIIDKPVLKLPFMK